MQIWQFLLIFVAILAGGFIIFKLMKKPPPRRQIIDNISHYDSICYTFLSQTSFQLGDVFNIYSRENPATWTHHFQVIKDKIADLTLNFQNIKATLAISAKFATEAKFADVADTVIDSDLAQLQNLAVVLLDIEKSLPIMTKIREIDQTKPDFSRSSEENYTANFIRDLYQKTEDALADLRDFHPIDQNVAAILSNFSETLTRLSGELKTAAQNQNSGEYFSPKTQFSSSHLNGSALQNGLFQAHKPESAGDLFQFYYR